jgi:hypothetical protein
MAKDKILDSFNTEVGVEPELVETSTNPEVKVNIVPEEPKTDNVTVSKEFLENLMSRVENLEGKPKPTKKVNEHFAYLRLWDNKIVLGVKRFYTEKALSEKNDKDEKRLFAELNIKDNSDKVTVDWLDFLNQINGENKFKVKIIKEVAEEISTSQGNMLSRNLDEYNNKKFMTRDIDLEVISYQYTCNVQFIEGPLSGQEITLNSESLNL